MRIEVFKQNQPSDEFVYGSTHGGSIEGNLDPKTLAEVYAALTSECERIGRLLEAAKPKSQPIILTA